MTVDNSTNTKTSIKDVLTSMAENSSIHGVSRWVTSRHWYQRVLWILLFLAAAGGMFYQLSLLFSSFRSYPVKTTVDLKFSSLAFPAVSFCNMNPIKSTKLSMTSAETQTTINGTDASAGTGRKKRSPNQESVTETDAQSQASKSSKQSDQKTSSVRKDFSVSHNRPHHSSASQSRGPHKRYRRALTKAPSPRGKWWKYLGGGHRVTGAGDGDLGGFKSGKRPKRYATTAAAPAPTSSPSYPATTSGYGYDGSWSYFQDYQEEQDKHVKDEWNQRVTKFQTEFQKNPTGTREKVGHLISDMLVSCAFNGHECYQDNFTLFQSLEYGNCYTFQDPSYVTKRSGPHLGLRMTLNIERKEYLEDYVDAFGMRLVIHEPGTFPFPEEEGFTLNPHYETTIGMKLVSIQRASQPHGDCESGEAFMQMFGIRYTIPACLKLCRQREIISQCECIPSTSYISVGNDESLTLCSNATKHQECEAFINYKVENNMINCDCRSPCRQRVYETSLSGRAWPSHKFLVQNIMGDICGPNKIWYFNGDCYYINSQVSLSEATTEKLSENFLKVIVHYEDLNYEEIKEEPMYDGFQFVSDVGGTLGLFVGASILSFVEILQFLIELLNFFRSKLFMRSTHPLTPITVINGQEYYEKPATMTE